MSTAVPSSIQQSEGEDYVPVVIYCRVSTDDKGQTNETQERVCREFCQNNGFTVLSVYRDEESGTTMDRPGWSRLVNRVINERDVDFVVAYDQSRVTRMENFSALRENFKPYRCKFRFVKMDIDDDSMAGKIVHDIFTHVNNEENRIRNERTRLGMQTRKLEGKHVGRPARFLFAEDLDVKPDGCNKVGFTIVLPEKTIFDYARSGYTLNYVATKILQIPHSCLIYEMHERQPNNPKCRYRGVKDRYTTYMTLYAEAISNRFGGRKGSSSQRVGNVDENLSQRVVE